MTTEELSRAVAEIVGDEGFERGACPQGHGAEMMLSGDKVGDVCPSCLYGAAHDAAKQYHGMAYWEKRGAAEERLRSEDHPEWRIGRGEPKPYAESLDLLVPVVEAWCQTRNLSWLIHGNHWTPGRVYADVSEHPTQEYEWNGEQGPTPAAALAEAFLEAVKEYVP